MYIMASCTFVVQLYSVGPCMSCVQLYSIGPIMTCVPGAHQSFIAYDQVVPKKVGAAVLCACSQALDIPARLLWSLMLGSWGCCTGCQRRF